MSMFVCLYVCPTCIHVCIHVCLCVWWGGVKGLVRDPSLLAQTEFNRLTPSHCCFTETSKGQAEYQNKWNYYISIGRRGSVIKAEMDVIDGCLRNELTRRGTSVPVMISSKGGRVWRGGRHLDMAPLQPLIDGNITQPPLSPYNAGYLFIFS